MKTVETERVFSVGLEPPCWGTKATPLEVLVTFRRGPAGHTHQRCIWFWAHPPPGSPYSCPVPLTGALYLAARAEGPLCAPLPLAWQLAVATREEVIPGRVEVLRTGCCPRT